MTLHDAHGDTASKSRRHILALDGVRGSAILLVIVRHLSLMDIGVHPADPLLDRTLHAVESLGWVGVDLFFVLSGYLITGILLDAKDHESAFKWFWLRRALRIFPLYYAALLILFLIAPLVWPLAGDPSLPAFKASWPWYASYAINYRQASLNLYNTGHFWSLAVEEQFYLIWPFIVLRVNRTTLWKAMVAMIVAALAIRIWLVYYSSFGVLAAYTFAPARMDVLAAGALVALATRSTTALPRAAKSLPYVGAASTVGLVALAIVGSGGFTNENPLIATFGYTLIAAIGATVLFGVVERQASQRTVDILESTTLRAFGKYSYCLYVVHYPLFMIVEPVVRHLRLPRIGGSAILIWIVSATLLVGSSFAIAWTSWRFFEGPLNGLKRYVRLGPKRVTPVPVA